MECIMSTPNTALRQDSANLLAHSLFSKNNEDEIKALLMLDLPIDIFSQNKKGENLISIICQNIRNKEIWDLCDQKMHIMRNIKEREITKFCELLVTSKQPEWKWHIFFKKENLIDWTYLFPIIQSEDINNHGYIQSKYPFFPETIREKIKTIYQEKKYVECENENDFLKLKKTISVNYAIYKSMLQRFQENHEKYTKNKFHFFYIKDILNFDFKKLTSEQKKEIVKMWDPSIWVNWINVSYTYNGSSSKSNFTFTYEEKIKFIQQFTHYFQNIFNEDCQKFAKYMLYKKNKNSLTYYSYQGNYSMLKENANIDKYWGDFKNLNFSNEKDKLLYILANSIISSVTSAPKFKTNIINDLSHISLKTLKEFDENLENDHELKKLINPYQAIIKSYFLYMLKDDMSEMMKYLEKMKKDNQNIVEKYKENNSLNYIHMSYDMFQKCSPEQKNIWADIFWEHIFNISSANQIYWLTKVYDKSPDLQCQILSWDKSFEEKMIKNTEKRCKNEKIKSVLSKMTLVNSINANVLNQKHVHHTQSKI